jgi:hypothetical protein
MASVESYEADKPHGMSFMANYLISNKKDMLSSDHGKVAESHSLLVNQTCYQLSEAISHFSWELLLILSAVCVHRRHWHRLNATDH